MKQILLWWSLGLSLLFTGSIAGARLLPEREPDLTGFDQLFFQSPDCEIPCLLGVRPGMALIPAVERLRVHPWVRGVTQPDLFKGEQTIAWNWSGSQPTFIDASVPGNLNTIATIGDSGHVVTRMVIHTNLRFYDVQRALGSSDSGGVLYWSGDDKLTYDVSYYDPDVRLRTTLRTELTCPALLLHFYWNTRVEISQNEGPLPQEYVPPEDLSGICRWGRARS